MEERSGPPYQESIIPRGVGATGVFSQTFQALGYRDYRYLWLGQLVSSGAMWMQMVVLPILVLNLSDGSAVQLGLVMAVRTVPALALGLFAGVAVDMWKRTTILMATRLFTAVLAGAFAALVLGGWVELWHLYLYALLRGSSMVFDQPARRAMIPSMVPPDTITNALALNSGIHQLMRILGAAIAALLLATSGIGSAFLAMAILNVIGVPLVMALRVPDHARAGFTGLQSIVADIASGFRFAWRVPAVKGGLLVAMVHFTFGLSYVDVFAPLLAREVLEIGDGGYGAMVSVLGVGGVVGTLVMAFLNPSRRRGLFMLGSLALYGTLFMVLSGATYISPLWLVFIAVALVGMGQSTIMPVAISVVLDATPTEMRGRTMALMGLDRSMVSLGATVAGFAAATMGSQLGLLAFGGVCVAAAGLFLVGYPAFRRA